MIKAWPKHCWNLSLQVCLFVLVYACAQDKSRAELIREEMSQENGANAQSKLVISWEDKIDSRRFGLTPNPKIDGKTLAEVISSMTAGRDDGQLCSACHNKDEALGDYGLPVAKNAASIDFDPSIEVGTTRKAKWKGPDGWAKRFIANKTKPANIKAVMQAWVDGGCK